MKFRQLAPLSRNQSRPLMQPGWGLPRNLCIQVLAAFLFLLSLVSGQFPAHAFDYPPPPSYSHAELMGRDFSGQNLRVAEFANSNLILANFSAANLRGAVFSAATMTDTNFQGSDLTYAMLDQIVFNGVDFRDAILVDSMFLRSTFEAVEISGADFTGALLDGAQIKKLCLKASGVNSRTGVATRDSLGCEG